MECLPNMCLNGEENQVLNMRDFFKEIYLFNFGSKTFL